MVIQWLGMSCLKIQTKYQEQNITVMVDPLDASAGPKLARLQADLLLYTNDLDDPQRLINVGATGLVIDTPGEFDFKNIFVHGMSSAHQSGNSRLYLLEIDEVSLAVLGILDHELKSNELELLEGADVVCVPVGGHDALTAEQALKVVNQIEPRIVLPYRFGATGIKKPVDGVEKFCKTMGLACETVDKIKITKKDLPSEETQLTVLSL